jgi:putative MATE family efflux protein
LNRAIFLLAVPMVLEMVMESLFAVADVFWVSHLGADAVATVGLTESLMIIIYTLAVGLAIGVTATVARRTGEKATDDAAHAAVQGLSLGAMVSLCLCLVGALAAPQLLRLMGASPAVLQSGTPFARVMLGGSITAFLLFIINAVFRGAGDAAVAMRVLWLSNGINILLGPMLIFGLGPFPHMGVTGAAVATTIGRGVGLLFALSRLTHGSGHLRVGREHLRLEWRAMTRLMRLSASGTFQVLVGSMSWIFLVRLMSSYGSTAMAGYTIAIRLVLFALLPAWGLSNAAATLVGQSLGAGKPDRAESAVWLSAKWNLAFLGCTALVFILFAPAIVHAFTREPGVAAVAIYGLRAVALGFPCFAFGMVFTQSFNGAGDTLTPTWINLGVFWIFEIPFAWAMANLTGLGYRGIFLAVLAAYTLLAAVSALLFRRGAWRTMRV